VNTLRLAVIGAGRLGGFHAQKAAAHQGVDLVAVADPSPEARRCVAEQCQTQAVADPRELAGRVDAVVIAAPTCLHHRLGMEWLGRGVHVLMEKPLCPTRAEAEELVETARKNHVVLQVGHVERFNPAWDAARSCVSAPKYIEAVRSSGFTFRSIDVGVVLDLMIHDIDLVLSLVNSPLRKVEALGISVMGGHEDVANARLHFASGCVATLSASRVSYEAARRMQVWSAEGFASIDFATRSATLVRPCDAILERQFDVAALSADQVEHYKNHLFEDLLRRETREADAVDALALELDDFIEAIRQSREPRVSGEDARDAVAVAQRVLNQIHAHAWDETLVGPMAAPHPAAIPSPHWNLAPTTSPAARKKAG